MKNYLRKTWMMATLGACIMMSCTNAKQVTNETEIIPIADNAKPRLMPTGIFTQVTDSMIKAKALEAGVPASVSVVLMKCEGKEILFDAGNGVEDSQLLPTLSAKNLNVDDIDMIFITHMHGDHIGGLLNGEKAVFGKATLYVPSIELNAWMEMDNAQVKTMVEAYKDRMVTFDENAELPCGIKPIPAYGHTPGHTIYRKDNALIVGDIMHGVTLQLENPEICARFDMDHEKAIASRKQVIELARQEGLTMYGMHFPEPYYMTLSE